MRGLDIQHVPLPHIAFLVVAYGQHTSSHLNLCVIREEASALVNAVVASVDMTTPSVVADILRVAAFLAHDLSQQVWCCPTSSLSFSVCPFFSGLRPLIVLCGHSLDG